MNDRARTAFLSPDTRRCPFDHYRLLRETAPVSFVPEIGMFVVSTYELILEVVRNPQLFASRGRLDAAGARTRVNYSPEADALLAREGLGRSAPTLVNNDPPSHSGYRKLMADTFRVSRVRELEPYIARTADTLVKEIRELRECDVVERIAMKLPSLVIADQLGVTRDDIDKFKDWVEALLYLFRPPKPEEELIEDARRVAELHRFMMRRMDERRRAPQDDIISDLVNSRLADGRPLSDREAMSVIEQLLVGGIETTASGIASGLLELAKRPDLQSRLRAAPDGIARFVEEILRLHAPAQGLVRTTTADTTLGGVEIPAGATVMVLYGSANRDEQRFPDAEQLRLDRSNGGAHLAFGSGLHHCLGSELARIEMRCAFQAFLSTFAAFELAVPEDSLVYNPLFTVRGLLRLPLRLRAASP